VDAFGLLVALAVAGRILCVVASHPVQSDSLVNTHHHVFTPSNDPPLQQPQPQHYYQAAKHASTSGAIGDLVPIHQPRRSMLQSAVSSRRSEEQASNAAYYGSTSSGGASMTYPSSTTARILGAQATHMANMRGVQQSPYRVTPPQIDQLTQAAGSLRSSVFDVSQLLHPLEAAKPGPHTVGCWGNCGMCMTYPQTPIDVKWPTCLYKAPTPPVCCCDLECVSRGDCCTDFTNACCGTSDTDVYDNCT